MTILPSDARVCEFIADLRSDDLSPGAHRRLALALADTAAVCAAGRPAPAAAIAADYAEVAHPGREARALLDGRPLGVVGAALANGVLANVLDFDDGHRLTKGHPSAVVIPAAVAVAQLVDAAPDELLAAIAVGYEIAIRAGIALHGRELAYHASGAWGGLGAAAAACRLLGLTDTQTIAALGLAEYHAPVALIMRSCGDPQMTKDACGWGAAVGVSSALLAARGFTGVRPQFLDAQFDDLGVRWRVQELYVKAYPCCRWTQPAIAAALAAVEGRRLEPSAIARVCIRTFDAAGGLAKLVPTTTEEAQYSLLWPVACALVSGRFGVQEVLGPFSDPDVEAFFDRIDVELDPELTAEFPDRRLASVRVELDSGERLCAGPLPARGEPDDPGLAGLVADKVAAVLGAAPEWAARRSDGVRALDADQLLALLRDAQPVAADA